MRNRGYLVLAAALAISVMGIGASTAAATRLRILNSSRGIRMVWTEFEVEGAGSTVRCPLTMEGTFHQETFVKRAGTLIASITRAALATERCTGGRGRILTESLPWNLTYESFAGTLPQIEEIAVDLIGAEIAFQPEGSVLCLMQSTTTKPVGGLFHFFASIARKIGHFTLGLSFGIPLTGSGGLCAFGGEGHVAGTASVTVLGETAGIEFALI